MKFCWSTLWVNDMEESLQFYQEIIGLSLNRRFKTEDNREIAFLGAGETKVELIQDAANSQVNIGADISLGFEVNSIDEMMAFLLEKGIPIHSGPYQPNPKTKFIFVTDPNGLKIQFVENS
ncbi:MAG: glyoxalase [Gracilibacter sp. BRH_c7a]|nr:MAG: glyoxalase [Gracilibacter sp. BRH_c7a]